MSHFTNVRVNFNDKDALVEAITRCGIKFEVHEEHAALQGMYNVGHKDNVIIRKNEIGSYSDFGVLYANEGVEGYCDDMDFRNKEGGNYIQRIVTQYQLILLEKAGLDTSNAVVTSENGLIRVTVGAGAGGDHAVARRARQRGGNRGGGGRVDADRADDRLGQFHADDDLHLGR
jgi:hypothetical protein